MSVNAWGAGGVRALADMSAKNVSFFGTDPLREDKKCRISKNGGFCCIWMECSLIKTQNIGQMDK